MVNFLILLSDDAVMDKDHFQSAVIIAPEPIRAKRAKMAAPPMGTGVTYLEHQDSSF